MGQCPERGWDGADFDYHTGGNGDYQGELAARLDLPYPLLSDPGLVLADQLGLPTFTAGGERLYKRLTLVLNGGRIEHAFYPVFPPNTHAAEVVDWLRRAA